MASVSKHQELEPLLFSLATHLLVITEASHTKI